MKTWNYRVVRRDWGDEESFEIHEIYYDDAGEICMWTQDPIAARGVDPEELTADLILMLEAAEKPTLEFVALPGSARLAQRRRAAFVTGQTASPWRWYCRICGAMGHDDERLARDEQAFTHRQECLPGRTYFCQAESGRLLHVWAY